MKKVTFNEKNNQVHHLVTWSYAYKSSRKKYWEFFAVDRLRFHRRIEEASNILGPILDTNHRCKIFNERFKIKEHNKYILFYLIRIHKNFYMFILIHFY